MPLEGFTETTLENLGRLIASKAALIKKAIGAYALPVERTATTLPVADECGEASVIATKGSGAIPLGGIIIE